MTFNLGTKKPPAVFICDVCGERVEMHASMVGYYERGGRMRHDECPPNDAYRRKGTLRPEGERS